MFDASSVFNIKFTEFMKWNFLKNCVFCVLLLTQFPVLAVDLSGKGGHVSSFPTRARGKKFNQLLQVREEIREINAEIHRRLDAILLSENAMERGLQALKLTEYLKYAYDDYKLSQQLDKMDDLAREGRTSTRLRLAAFWVLGEHSIPNTSIRSLLKFIAVVDRNPKITKEAKKTLNKLKAAYSQTGRKFSDLLAYSHESDNVREAIALLWVAIYENERERSSRLLKWLSNDDPNRRQIGLLIFEEMKRRGGGMVGSRAVKNEVLRLRKEIITAAENNSSDFDMLSSFLESEACDGHLFGHGPVMPRIH